MNRNAVDGLDATRTYWVPVVVSPCRDWVAVPGCRRGARFMVDRATCEVRRDEFSTFDSRTSCLRWIMEYRLELNRSLPGANIRAVQLDRWLLGLD